MDQVIPLLTVLLILSLINEKVTNFIRDNIWHLREFWNRPAKKLGLSKTFQPPADPKAQADNTENQVNLLSFSVGFVIAFTSNASLFSLLDLKAVATHTFFLDNYCGPTDPKYWVGCMLTGFFLTFGSKFFHDLLDLVMATKNLKKKLNDDTAYTLETKQKRQEYLDLPQGDIVQKALDENAARILAMPGVIGVGLGTTAAGVKCIQVKTDSSFHSPASPAIAVTVGSGIHTTVPCEYVTMEMPRIKAALQVSDEIANQKTPNSMRGTLGCAVRRLGSSDQLFLTCYHVVKGPGHSYDHFQVVGDETVVHPLNGSPIGSILDARRDSDVDVALIKPVEGLLIANDIPKIGPVTRMRQVRYEDASAKQAVRINGDKSQFRTGTIDGISQHISIWYGPNDTWQLWNLFSIKSDDAKPFSDSGDSGALVVDGEGTALGIIVAGNDTESYAIPIRSITDSFNLERSLA